MNYLELIVGFWRSHEENSFSTTEISLYFYLLEVCNNSLWKNPFKRNNAKVMADLGIKDRRTLDNARNKLSQFGLLKFEKNNTNPNVTYTLTCAKNEQATVQATVQVPVQVGVQEDDTKDKLNKTETKQSSFLEKEAKTDQNFSDQEIQKLKAEKAELEARLKASEEQRKKVAAQKTKEEHIEGSQYGDGVLHHKCIAHANQHPNMYPKEFYTNFLEHWTAPIQKGTKIGKEAWRDEKTFALVARLANSWNILGKKAFSPESRPQNTPAIAKPISGYGEEERKILAKQEAAFAAKPLKTSTENPF